MKNRFGTSWPREGFLTKQTKKAPHIACAGALGKRKKRERKGHLETFFRDQREFLQRGQILHLSPDGGKEPVSTRHRRIHSCFKPAR